MGFQGGPSSFEGRFAADRYYADEGAVTVDANREMTGAVVTAMHAALKPVGFRKRGLVFERPINDVLHLVQLQKSVSSDARRVKATVNLAIWLPALAPIRAGRPDSPTIAAAPWRERIGQLLAREDVWWTISSMNDAHDVGALVAGALRDVALPVLDGLSSAAAVRRQWEAGASPGLTEKQRIYMLERFSKIGAA
jgi:hypothetical protein